MRARPSVVCPLCGLPQLRSAIRAHVGSARCLEIYGARTAEPQAPTLAQRAIVQTVALLETLLQEHAREV